MKHIPSFEEFINEARVESANDENGKTTKVNAKVRQRIAEICKAPGSIEEKEAKVRAYLAGNKEVAAITAKGNEITVHTKGNMSSVYTFSTK